MEFGGLEMITFRQSTNHLYSRRDALPPGKTKTRGWDLKGAD